MADNMHDIQQHGRDHYPSTLIIRSWSASITLIVSGAVIASLLPACIDVAPPEINVPFELTAFGGDSGFVMTGTASVADQNGPCPVWLGDNGVVYHLFQSPSLANDVFDQIVSVGTTSRLVLSVRTDLELDCAFGRTATVLDVLEIQE